jgi:Uma2 family endonuclease
LLVVEVADTSVSRDRDVKIPIYGSSGIPEACLIDVQRRLVTVYRQPAADGYQSITEVTSGSLTPEGAPDVAVPFSELFR